VKSFLGFAHRVSKVDNIDVELGTGFGFMPGSDRSIVKAIFGYAFPVPSKSTEADSSPKSGRAFPAMRWVWVDQDTDRPIGGPRRAFCVDVRQPLDVVRAYLK